MRASNSRNILLYGAVAGLLILSAGLAYALWQEQQSETITFEFGGESISVEAEGG
ncbi:MAG: hypothetical protein VX529_16615 [Pseudomonadota bacterium]|jgi:TPP-dependent pyruvate/acetoin dehydrogenase alpha subunit|nr:hypothetical protein [Pseudomonadota bacterium]